MASPRIIQLSSDLPNIDALIVGITHIHASCIEYDKTEATFLPPLSYTRILQWWHERLNECMTGGRHIWVELQPISSRKAQLESPLKDNELKPIHVESDPDTPYEVAGLVALYKPASETGPFRGEVHKLLVSPNHRQKGVARRLMATLERVALAEGKTNLMLDTEIGSPAERVYPRLGYIEVGRVPNYGYSPVPGKMCDEVWFYKNLTQDNICG